MEALRNRRLYGFSDGTYVEIEEGLSEATVLIESRVSDS